MIIYQVMSVFQIDMKNNGKIDHMLFKEENMELEQYEV